MRSSVIFIWNFQPVNGLRFALRQTPDVLKNHLKSSLEVKLYWQSCLLNILNQSAVRMLLEPVTAQRKFESFCRTSAGSDWVTSLCCSDVICYLMCCAGLSWPLETLRLEFCKCTLSFSTTGCFYQHNLSRLACRRPVEKLRRRQTLISTDDAWDGLGFLVVTQKSVKK